MIKLLAWANGKRGGFFVVKRAAGLVLVTGFFERDAVVDYIDNIDPRDQVVDESLRNLACHACTFSLEYSLGGEKLVLGRYAAPHGNSAG